MAQDKNLNIRLAKVDDLATIVKFNSSLVQEIRGKEFDTERLTLGVKAVLTDKNRGFYTVVEKDNQIVAAALITYEWSDWRNAWFWWVQDVYVEHNYRQQGIYRTLYGHLRSQAKMVGVCGLRLYVYKDNTRAQEVYKKLGMIPSDSEMFEEML
jgi:GNAT superfamily N-acetyltransferase